MPLRRQPLPANVQSGETLWFGCSGAKKNMGQICVQKSNFSLDGNFCTVFDPTNISFSATKNSTSCEKIPVCAIILFISANRIYDFSFISLLENRFFVDFSFGTKNFSFF